MSNPGAVPGTKPTFGPQYWGALVAASLVAFAICMALVFLARARGWPYPPAIGIASYLFVMPLIQPVVGGQKRRWIPMFSIGVVSAAIGAAFVVIMLR